MSEMSLHSCVLLMSIESLITDKRPFRCPALLYVWEGPEQYEYRVQHGENPEHSRSFPKDLRLKAYKNVMSWLHEIHNRQEVELNG